MPPWNDGSSRSRSNLRTTIRPSMILKGIREKYASHHRVEITDAALRPAVEFSEPIHLLASPARQVDRRHRRGRSRAPTQEHDQAPGPRRTRGEDRKTLASTRTKPSRTPITRRLQPRDSAEKAPQGEGTTSSRSGVNDERDRRHRRRGVIAEVVSKMTGVPLTRLDKDESERLLARGRTAQDVVSQDARSSPSRVRSARLVPASRIPSDRWVLHLRRPLRRRQDPPRQGSRRVHVR